MALTAKEASNFSLRRVYGPCLSKGKRWYSLSSHLAGRKVSQFVKGKFFEAFPSEICRVRVDNLWRENGEHVPFEWFSTRNAEEAYVVSLFGLCGGLIKQFSSSDDGFLSSDTFKQIVDSINNLDISDLCGEICHPDTPKTLRIALLEKQLEDYRAKVREIESSIVAATLETPPNTPVQNEVQLHKIASCTSLGPISKKRQMKAACSAAFHEINSAFHCSRGSLGAVLGYGFIYGNQEKQMMVRATISEAVEIVLESKGLASALDLALTTELKQKQEAVTRIPDWVQLYVKLETKLPDDGWQTILNFLNLGRSGVSIVILFHKLVPFLIFNVIKF